jgi:D-threo-aldose 1-dehydrogenase
MNETTLAHETGTRAFGRGGLRVGPLGFGSAGLGNLYGAVADDVWPGCVPSAWDAGIRYFDVAPHYGLGLAEERLGRSLAGRPRDEYVLSTKVGRVIVPRANPEGASDMANQFDVPADRARVVDYSRDGVLRSVEGSLERLGVDRIDILFVHDPDDHYREALDGAFPALEELRAQGVIRSYGAGMNQSAMLTRFIENTDLDIVMLAGRFTLLDQSGLDDVLPAALSRGVSIAAAGVFNSGILATNRPSSDAHYDYETASGDLVGRVNAIADIAESHGFTVPELAARFPLRHPAVSTVVLGARSPQQVERNAALLARDVPEEIFRELVDSGLLSDHREATE